MLGVLGLLGVVALVGFTGLVGLALVPSGKYGTSGADPPALMAPLFALGVDAKCDSRPQRSRGRPLVLHMEGKVEGQERKEGEEG